MHVLDIVDLCGDSILKCRCQHIGAQYPALRVYNIPFDLDVNRALKPLFFKFIV
jgi:hypothetical protein